MVSARLLHLEVGRSLCQRQQGCDVAILGGRQARERVGEPGVRFDAVGLGGGDQAHDGSGALAGALGAGEQPVIAVMCSCTAVIMRSALLCEVVQAHRFKMKSAICVWSTDCAPDDFVEDEQRSGHPLDKIGVTIG